MLVDFEANTLDGKGDLQPPSETFIHIWQYKTRPEVASVIHMHPEHAVLLTICEKEIFPMYGSALAHASPSRVSGRIHAASRSRTTSSVRIWRR